MTYTGTISPIREVTVYPRVHFGLPGDGDVEGLTVRWPDGTVEEFPGGSPDRFLTVRKGQGRKPRG